MKLLQYDCEPARCSLKQELDTALVQEASQAPQDRFTWSLFSQVEESELVTEAQRGEKKQSGHSRAERVRGGGEVGVSHTDTRW